MSKRKKTSRKRKIASSSQSSKEIRTTSNLPQSSAHQASQNSHNVRFIGLSFLWFLGITWLAYFNALHGVFFFDDVLNIVENKTISDLGEMWKMIFHQPYLPNRSITYFTFALNYYFHGLQVQGYHIVNICLHACNGMLVFLIIRKIGSRFYGTSSVHSESNFSQRLNWSAYATASLLMVHPLMTACVNYTVQRAAELATIFCLAGFLSYIYFRVGSKTQKRLWAIGAIVCYWLAFRSKPIALTLPLVVLMYEVVCRINQPAKLRQLVKWGVPVLLLFGTILVVYLDQIGLLGGENQRGGFNSPHLWGPWQQFQAESRVFIHYWKMLLLPLPQWLCIDHDFRISGKLLDGWALFAMGGHALILFSAWRLVKKGYYLTFLGISWFYITLSPYWILPEQDLFLDYKAYMPAMGASLILADFFLWFQQRIPNRIIWIALIIGLMAMGLGVTWQRNQIYQNKLSLWEDTIKKAPEKARPYRGRGSSYADLELYDQAIMDYNQAIQLDPNYAEAYSNRGNSYANLKKYEQALADYNQAIQLNPGYARAYNNRGASYTGLKQYDQALADYNQAIQLKPDYAEAYNGRGVSYANLKQYDQALADYDQAIQLDPDYSEAYCNRGNSYAILMHYDQALADYNQAIQLKPDYAEAYNGRGVSYVNLKRYDLALSDYNQAIRVNPAYARAYNNRGVAYIVQFGMPEKGCPDLKKACELGECLQYQVARKDQYCH